MSVRTLVKSIQDIMRQDSGVDGDAQRISQLCWMFFLKIIDDQDQELELMRRGYRSPIPERFRWRTWAADPEGITGEELLEFVNNEMFPRLKTLQVNGQPGDRRRVVRDVFEDAYNYMKSGQLMRQVINKINGIDFNNLSERQHFGDIYEQILNDLQSAGNAGEYYTPRAVTAFMADRIDPRPGETLFDPACGTGGFLTCSIRHMRDRYVKRPEDERTMQTALRAVEKKQLPHMLCVTNMLLHGVEDPSFVRHDNTLARPYIGWEQKDRVDIVLTNPPFGGREEDGIESNFPQQFRTRETADLFLALIIRLLKPGGRAAVVLPDGSLFGEGVKTRLKEHLMEECNLHTIVRLPNSVFRPYASIGTNLLFFEKGEPTRDIWFYEHLVPEGQKAYSMTRPIRLEHLQPCIDLVGRRGAQGPGGDRARLEGHRRGGEGARLQPRHQEPAHGRRRPRRSGRTAGRTDQGGSGNGSPAQPAQGDPGGRAPAMNADQLLAHYDRIADAPDAIPRLRRFILDLAVRGKLVQQDPDDEPAAELLKRLSRVPSPTLRNQRQRSKEESELPQYQLPGTWYWVRIGAHLDLVNGMAFKPADWLPSGLKIVRIQNLNRTDAPFNHCDPRKVRERFLINDGAFLISWSGTPGTSFGAFIWDRGPAVLNQHIFRCDFRIRAFNPQYLRLAINGRLDEMIAKAHGGVGLQHITKGKLEALLIALPPLAEQRRIVGRVDELMALCDRLAAAREAREAARDRLAAASLARLNRSDPDPKIFRSHAAFTLKSFVPLTTRPDQIKALRQTILNLAMRGELVEQDPNDEPAAELLNRIAMEKGRARRAIVTIGREAEPYSVPGSWKWASLDELITAGPQNGISPKPTTRGDAPKAITLTATTSGVFNSAHFKRVEVNVPHDSDFWLRDGDLLFQRGNTREYVGIAAVYEGPAKTFLFPDLIMKVRASGLISLRFVHLASVSPHARAYLSENASGAQATMPKINQTTLVSLPIPLPPLAEQHRIVAKVDELMTLCDRLEARLGATDATRRRLFDSILHHALSPTQEAMPTMAAARG